MKCQDCEKFNWCDDGSVWCDDQYGNWVVGDSEFLYKNCPLPKVEEINKQESKNEKTKAAE